ncbi:MAG: divalent cation tolerance protein CutA, partial [Cyanobacteria bacterium J06641_5]
MRSLRFDNQLPLWLGLELPLPSINRPHGGQVDAGSEAEAESLATALVEAGLAACVNLTPVRSIYTWQ